MEVLRRVLVQTCTPVITDGKEVVNRREKEPEGDGLPPGHARIASPYDTDARWGVKREEFWLGYKLHVTETCDDEPRCGSPAAADRGTGWRGHDRDCAARRSRNLITHVATTDATVTDNQMTSVIDDELAGKTLAPGRHYIDSGYLSAALVVAEAARYGIALTGPLLADTSAQARAGPGTPAPTSPPTTAPAPSPARRAGVEGTMHQAASHGARRACYRGLPKTRLDHAYMACALNLLRLHAYGPVPRWTAGGPATWHTWNSASPHDPELTTGIAVTGKSPVSQPPRRHARQRERSLTAKLGKTRLEEPPRFPAPASATPADR